MSIALHCTCLLGRLESDLLVCQQEPTKTDRVYDEAIGRSRARLLLVLRYMLWRLEAYRCRSCWDRDIVLEPGAADPSEEMILQNIKLVCKALRADHEPLLSEYADLIYAVRSRTGV